LIYICMFNLMIYRQPAIGLTAIKNGKVDSDKSEFIQTI
jgi:hypothetical protein